MKVNHHSLFDLSNFNFKNQFTLHFPYREKLDMLLEALKDENLTGQSNGELARILDDMLQQNQSFGEIPKSTSANGTMTPPPVVTSERRISFSFKGSNVKTEKDKYNSKERRNSRYYVRNGDKEAIQTRANSLKLAINTVMEHSGKLNFIHQFELIRFIFFSRYHVRFT